MLNVIICAVGAPDDLVRTLNSIIPAIPEGIVREGWIVDDAAHAEIAAIADAAGCHYVTQELNSLLRQISRDHSILIVAAGVWLEEGWWREVASHFEIYRDPPQLTVFRHANAKNGLIPRLGEIWHSVCTSLPLIPSAHEAMIVPVSDLEARKIKLPARVTGTPTRLRARAILHR